MRVRRFVFGVAVAALVAVLLAPSPAVAQQVEVSAGFGYNFGGDVDGEVDLIFGPRGLDLEIDEGESLRLAVDFAVSQDLQVELLLSRQETELVVDGGLFRNQLPILELDVDYYHVGVLYRWAPGQIHPFVVGSIGATRLAPSEGGLSDETRFSLSVGGGVKIFVAPNVGFRFEGRYFSTVLDDDDDTFCDGFRCERFRDGSYFSQAELSAGIVFAF